jgi:NAD-dependent SIR2 family protein deacetylase
MIHDSWFMIKDSGIFVLTGAGISAESGIPVFQGTNWRGRSHYELANIAAWHADPELSTAGMENEEAESTSGRHATRAGTYAVTVKKSRKT